MWGLGDSNSKLIPSWPAETPGKADKQPRFHPPASGSIPPRSGTRADASARTSEPLQSRIMARQRHPNSPDSGVHAATASRVPMQISVMTPESPQLCQHGARIVASGTSTYADRRRAPRRDPSQPAHPERIQAEKGRPGSPAPHRCCTSSRTWPHCVKRVGNANPHAIPLAGPRGSAGETNAARAPETRASQAARQHHRADTSPRKIWTNAPVFILLGPARSPSIPVPC